MHRLFSSLVALVNLINVTSGKPDGMFLGHGRMPSFTQAGWPTSPKLAGRLGILGRPQLHGNGYGQDSHNLMAMDTPVALVVLCVLSERLAQLETATVAYAQGSCSLYNLFYLAYEKGFAAKILNSKLYKDYQQEGLLHA